MHNGRTIVDLLELVDRVGAVVWGDPAMCCPEGDLGEPSDELSRSDPSDGHTVEWPTRTGKSVTPASPFQRNRKR
jgi:hypothetical protein